MKNIVILGSTGSIGRQTLEVAKKLNYKVFGISCQNNFDVLKKQILEFRPEYALIANGGKFGNKIDKTKILYGPGSFKKLVSHKKIDLVVNALVGAAGILPSYWTLQAKKDLALANKESLVCAGNIIIKAAKKNKVKILPIDSEHSAIWQCLQGENKKNIKKIILTCSGGPFFGKSRAKLKNVKIKQVLNHPTWQMGKKITVDSATLMNKGFEIIEACHLFNVSLEKIKVIVHPESIIHSMVEFYDGSIKAQISSPDMRVPIQYALTWPERKNGGLVKDLNFIDLKINFKKPDIKTFFCLDLARKAFKISGTAPAVLNAANEEAVKLFLTGKIKFLDIERINKQIMSQHKVVKNPKLNDILKADKWARKKLKLKESNLFAMAKRLDKL
ncbi:MAG: 1-deoxy-D-xylulose-5-phosphate reductoisomerase [Patescibacteria group bacterium]